MNPETQNHPPVVTLQVMGADVFLQDYNPGQGKITISSLNAGAFSFYWGSMGSDLKEFLLTINPDYFAGKLCAEPYTFDPKTSATNVRKYIRNDLSYELPFYKFMSAQKELRQAIKLLEHTSSKDEFVARCNDLPNNLLCLDLTYKEEMEFKEIISGIFEEPWFFIGEKTSAKYNWLVSFHAELKRVLTLKN